MHLRPGRFEEQVRLTLFVLHFLLFFNILQLLCSYNTCVLTDDTVTMAMTVEKYRRPNTAISTVTRDVINELMAVWLKKQKDVSPRMNTTVPRLVIENFLAAPRTQGLGLWKTELRRWEIKLRKKQRNNRKKKVNASYTILLTVAKLIHHR